MLDRVPAQNKGGKLWAKTNTDSPIEVADVAGCFDRSPPLRSSKRATSTSNKTQGELGAWYVGSLVPQRGQISR